MKSIQMTVDKDVELIDYLIKFAPNPDIENDE